MPGFLVKDYDDLEPNLFQIQCDQLIVSGKRSWSFIQKKSVTINIDVLFSEAKTVYIYSYDW